MAPTLPANTAFSSAQTQRTGIPQVKRGTICADIVHGLAGLLQQADRIGILPHNRHHCIDGARITYQQ